jgi:hypothetical protein
VIAIAIVGCGVLYGLQAVGPVSEPATAAAMGVAAPVDPVSELPLTKGTPVVEDPSVRAIDAGSGARASVPPKP